ncbi:MAG: M1 family peptidase, partial [Thaumarchaeota archaeon]|nr:M1 family peptidase [Nitrososphaerota archaeon]
MKAVLPISYDLEFEPDFNKFKFRGKEKILIKVSKPTRQIVLHAAELEINDCTILWNEKKLRAKARLDEKNEKLILSLPEKISGKATLLINFVGT